MPGIKEKEGSLGNGRCQDHGSETAATSRVGHMTFVTSEA